MLDVGLGTLSEWISWVHSLSQSACQELGRQQRNPLFKVFTVGDKETTSSGKVCEGDDAGQALGEQRDQHLSQNRKFSSRRWLLIWVWSTSWILRVKEGRGGGRILQAVAHVKVTHVWSSIMFLGTRVASVSWKQRVTAQNRTWRKAVTTKMVVRRWIKVSLRNRILAELSRYWPWGWVRHSHVRLA